MMKTTTWQRNLLLLLVFCLLGSLGACGGDDEEGEGSSNTAVFVPETREGESSMNTATIPSSEGSAQMTSSGTTGTSQPPTIVSEPETTAVVNQPYLYTVRAEGTPPITYELQTAPEGMTIDAESGDIRWIPKVRDTFQPVAVEAVARNDYGTDTQIWTITVTR
ncbi:MAG: hypothetical protein D6812_09170 [Deltaproteobacteria bacterium]|nr:MAG: hypothetical protein D6812_09170 [Deltaproteobacteria bacterium]